MNGIAGWIGRNRDLLFVLALLAIVGTIFVPLPPFVLDFLLVVSIALGVLILMTVIYVSEPVRFSAFPSILLLTTAYRLALNVATTRQILGNAGRDGTRAAGIAYFSHPMAKPATMLTRVITMPATASPRTNFEAPSIAP